MEKIEPAVLKRLRSAKGWTQDQLAEKTKADGLPKIDKQTISRLERGDRSGTRSRTITQLARAFGVEPEVLTGKKPMPEGQLQERRIDQLNRRSPLNVRIATGPRNALSLAAARYHVDQSQIVELAPLLFVWAAEESLRQRREQISAFEEKLDEAQAFIGWRLPYLKPFVDVVPDPENALAVEQESIEKRDLLGCIIDRDLNASGFGPYSKLYPSNPISTFLERLVEPFREVAQFDGWSDSEIPYYRICPDEAAELVGNDCDAAKAILEGNVSLSEMPKELNKDGMAKERAEWVRSKAKETRKQGDLDLKLLGEEGELSR